MSCDCRCLACDPRRGEIGLECKNIKPAASISISKLVAAFPESYARGRERMKTVIHLWKGDKTLEQLAVIAGVSEKEVERWSKLALHGAVVALRNDRLSRVVKA